VTPEKKARQMVGVDITIILFCIAVALAMFGESIYIVFIPNFFSESGIPVAEIGIFFTVFYVVNALISIPAGYMSDRMGRNIMIFSLFVLSVTIFSYSLADTRGELLLLRALHAAAHAFIFPISRAYVMDKSTEENRGRAMAIYGVSFTVAGMLGPLIGGIMREQTGGFDLLFHAAAIFPLLAAVFLLVVVRDLGKGFTMEKMKVPTRDLIINRPFTVLLAMFVVLYCVSSVMTIIVPLFAIEGLGVSYVFLGIVSMCVGIVLTISQFTVGTLSDRHGRKKLLIYPFIIYAAGIFLLGSSVNSSMFLGAYMLIGIGAAPYTTVAYSIIGDLVREEQWGTASGAANSASNIGMIFGPLLASALGGAVGLRMPLYLCSLLVVITIAMLFIMLPPDNRRAAEFV